MDEIWSKITIVCGQKNPFFLTQRRRSIYKDTVFQIGVYSCPSFYRPKNWRSWNTRQHIPCSWRHCQPSQEFLKTWFGGYFFFKSFCEGVSFILENLPSESIDWFVQSKIIRGCEFWFRRKVLVKLFILMTKCEILYCKPSSKQKGQK